MKLQSKYKKRGWFGDSYRHYLAAKGVKTRYDASKFAQLIGGSIRTSQELKDEDMRRDLSSVQYQPYEVQTDMLKREIEVPIDATEERIVEAAAADVLTGPVDRGQLWSVWTPQIGRQYIAQRQQELKKLEGQVESAHRRGDEESKDVAQFKYNELSRILGQELEIIALAASTGTAQGMSPTYKGILAKQVEVVHPDLSGMFKRKETMERKRKDRQRRRR